MKKYDEADRLISAIIEYDGNSFFHAQILILKGILCEKKYRDKKTAEQCYIKGINDLSLYGRFGNEYAAYAYFGLSRIYDDKGDKHASHTYRKEANKLADFKKIDFDK
jgi:hypothetical protein